MDFWIVLFPGSCMLTSISFHNPRTKCLPYILADQGYDVWVGNNRGTSHSKKNSHMPNYWDYCFDHFVQYDQPTMINSILKET